MQNKSKNKWIVLTGILAICSLLLVLFFVNCSMKMEIQVSNYPEIGMSTLYFDLGEGLSEENKLVCASANDRLVFEIPLSKYKNIQNLRFNPVNYQKNVQVDGLQIRLGNRVVFETSGMEIVEKNIAAANISTGPVGEKSVYIEALNFDPHLYFGTEVLEAYNYWHGVYSLVYGGFLILMVVVLAVTTYCLGRTMVLFGICEKEFLKDKKKWVIFAMTVLFVLTRLFVLIRYKGYFFNDEFYFTAEANPEYVSSYARAPYLTWMVQVFSAIAGNRYITLKAVPFVLGLISYGCVMYLVVKNCEMTLSIVLAGLFMSFHALFIFNDFYIRMYSFQETELLILAVLLYKIGHSENRKNRIILSGIGFLFALFICVATKDVSGKIPFVAFAIALVYLWLGEKIWESIQKKKAGKYIGFAVLLLWILFEILVVGYKSGRLPSGLNSLATLLFSYFYHLMMEFRLETSTVIVKYLLTHGIFLTFIFVTGGLLLFRKDEKKLLPIYLLSAIPLLAFCSLLYDSRLIRAFIGYIVIAVCLVVIFLDGALKKKKFAGIIVTGCVLSIALSPVDMSWSEFGKQLYLYHEVVFSNYGQLVEDAKVQMDEGKKLVTLLGGEQVVKTFELKPAVDLCVWDENQNMNYTNEELAQALAALESSGEEYVMVLDRVGADKLFELGIYYTFLEKHDYKIYDKGQEFNSVYLVCIEK